MKITIKLFGFFALVALLAAFSPTNNDSVVGTYGDMTLFLNIRPDQTFSYIDKTNPNQPISLSGKWEMKGKKVMLKATNSEASFHSVWTIKNNGQVAKSHKGLLFYRICKVEK